MTLTEFLLARIAEDESLVLPPARGDWARSVDWQPGGVSVMDTRWLSECEAKRRIVEAHDDGEGRDDGCTGQHDEYPAESAECHTLHILAIPYAGHPDFDESWLP